MDEMYVVQGSLEYAGICEECGQPLSVRDYSVLSASGKAMFDGPLCDDCVLRWTVSPLCFETLLR